VLQLEALEKTIGQQQRELKELNEQNRQQLEAFNQTKQDLQTKLDKVWSLGKLKVHALLSSVQHPF
jgi:dsDNA-specific endonuclease/ATPase MutS2